MKQKSTLLLLTLLAVLTTALHAQSLPEREGLQILYKYDETNSLLEGHKTQILQDHDGLLWIATWNGIYRFDGYEFHRIKPQTGDKCSINSDRIRDIWLSEQGNIYVCSEDEYYLLDTRTYRFSDLTPEECAEAERQRQNQPSRGRFVDGILEYTDPQGLLWMFYNEALYCMSPIESPAKPLDMHQPDMVRCIQNDSKGRIWVATRNGKTLRLLTADGELIGYMGPNGQLSKGYQSFGASVYCITQTSDGLLWLGCKPEGLIRLKESGSGQFTVEHISGLEGTNVYGIAEDRKKRLWLAILNGGIACVENPAAATPTVHKSLPGYPTDRYQRVRHIFITDLGYLLAATTEGLVVSKIEDNISSMKFKDHRRDPQRRTSLCCNAVMDIIGTPDDRFFLATETGGLCEITSRDLMADTLSFRHYDVDNGLLPSDMLIGLSLAPRGHLMAVGNTQLIDIDINRNTYESLGHHFFHTVYHFSEARPLLIDRKTWLVGTTNGAFFLPSNAAHHRNYQPPLLLTGLSFPDGKRRLAVNHIDTLRLTPEQRNLTLHFSALDYVDTKAISYQYRLVGDDNPQWSNLGHAHSISMLNLKPGTYQLQVRSTNADGVWTQNTRTITLIVEPTFWETPWAIVIFIAAALLVIGVIVATALYIRRIKRKQQETLAAYLEAIAKAGEAKPAQSSPDTPIAPAVSATDEQFLQRLLEFVDKNISNSNADVAMMSSACAVSRSVLQRKVKQLMGVSPADFLREARLKRACQLLQQPDAVVSDVAYQCGFNDPKYFSRCFKQSMGASPTEYKAQA